MTGIDRKAVYMACLIMVVTIGLALWQLFLYRDLTQYKATQRGNFEPIADVIEPLPQGVRVYPYPLIYPIPQKLSEDDGRVQPVIVSGHWEEEEMDPEEKETVEEPKTQSKVQELLLIRPPKIAR